MRLKLQEDRLEGCARSRVLPSTNFFPPSERPTARGAEPFGSLQCNAARDQDWNQSRPRELAVTRSAWVVR